MKKLLLVLLSCSMLLGVVACAPKPQPQQEPPETKGVYDDIISLYTALLTAKQNGEALVAPSTDGMDAREAAIAQALYGVVDFCQNAESMGYGYKDMDGNGTLELILMTRYTSVMAVFTVSGDKPILLETGYGQGNSCLFARRNRFLVRRKTTTDSTHEYTYYTCHVDGDKMVYETVFGNVVNTETKETVERFQTVDGNRTLIDEETFTDLHYEHRQATQVGYINLCKWIAPRIHSPLADSAATKDLPVADFSSYAAILDTYKAISTCLDKFASSDWVAGKYDDLFAFPSETAYEYYNRLLFGAYNDHYRLGYDEIDLNGDGQDELVLLKEDYGIKAIFTQENGVPVMLESAPYEVGWLDAQGLIHVDREEYYELEYSLYEFKSDGSYTLAYSILATTGGRYLTKDGKTEGITFEESMEFYNDYCCYSRPFEPNEHTRNVSQLTYTPLVKATENLPEAAVGQTWYKYVNLDGTNGQDFANSHTYMTFETVTNTQMKVNVKYAYTFFYPDPDREDYLLSDTTESFLELTVRAENGRYVFDGNGLKGRFEFGEDFLWIIIEESTDERFPAGHHCYRIYRDQNVIG